MKKTYGYIPLWFLLIVPPLLIFTFIFNFIQCGLAILCGPILLKIKDPFNNYYKRIMTAFVLAIEADIICILFYALPELLYKIDFLNKNLITPLEYNPYKNIFSLLLSIYSIVFAMQYPLEPNQVSLGSAFTIGIPAFFLTFEENQKKYSSIIIVGSFSSARSG